MNFTLPAIQRLFYWSVIIKSKCSSYNTSISLHSNKELENYNVLVNLLNIFTSIVGAVLANRLTEVENWNVLLLEAGGDETEISDVPLMAGYLQLSKLDWKYKSEPQGTACLGNYL